MAPDHDPVCTKPFNFSLCLLRHKAAINRIKRGFPDKDSCAYCPAILEKLQEEPVKDLKTTYKPGICSVCKESKTIKARGMCSKCYAQDWSLRRACGTGLRVLADEPTSKPPETSAPTATEERDKSSQAGYKAVLDEAKKAVGANDPAQLSSLAQTVLESIRAQNMASENRELIRENARLRLENTRLSAWVDRLTRAVAA